MTRNPSKEAYPVDIHVGRRLHLRRNMLRMSQDDLGKQVGITFQQIQKYERETNRISTSCLWAFERILEVSENYFFEGLSGITSTTNPDHHWLDSQESQHLIKAYYNIPELALRYKIRNLIRVLFEDKNA